MYNKRQKLCKTATVTVVKQLYEMQLNEDDWTKSSLYNAKNLVL